LRFAILLGGRPDSANARTARSLATAAVRAGHEVTLFFNHDGVYSAQPLSDLRESGVRLAACAYSARQRSVTAVPGVRWGGQLDWAEAVSRADRVLAFD
jgi:sulfur relay (sulfurtransferase) complex TusBCD TusD component (DsrE family)